MKITIKQLKQLIKEQVEEMAGPRKARDWPNDEQMAKMKMPSARFNQMSNEELVDELARLGAEQQGGYERETDEVDADEDACKREILSRMR